MTQKTSLFINPKRTRGGKRDGAGRPLGSGRFGEPTKAVRVPQSLIDDLQKFLIYYRQNTTQPMPSFIKASSKTSVPLPLYENKVAAGFPAPAETAIEKQLDLNQHLIKTPNTTFYLRVQGSSMIGAGIHPNDLLVVDRALQAREGNIIIASVDDEFTVKRLKIGKDKQIWLMPENETYAPLLIEQEMNFQIWGVVTNVIHALV